MVRKPILFIFSITCRIATNFWNDMSAGRFGSDTFFVRDNGLYKLWRCTDSYQLLYFPDPPGYTASDEYCKTWFYRCRHLISVCESSYSNSFTVELSIPAVLNEHFFDMTFFGSETLQYSHQNLNINSHVS